MIETIKSILRPNYIVMTVLQLLLPVFLWLGLGASVGWWVVALVFYFLYLAVGNNVGMHRHFCHGYFKFSKPIEHFITWCATVAGLGSPISYASIHVVHHKHSDTPLDPHGRQRGWKSVLFYFHRHIQTSEISFTRNLSKLLVKFSTMHDYYWAWVFATPAIMYLIGGFNFMLFAWCIPVSLTLWAVALVLLLQHDDVGASNTASYQWFGWGETFHKNHHDNPSLANHSGNSKKKDWTYLLGKWLSNA